MNNYTPNPDLAILQVKGGVMLFTIIRPERVYKGMVLLSSVNKDNQRTRVVCIKEFRYAEE